MRNYFKSLNYAGLFFASLIVVIILAMYKASPLIWAIFALAFLVLYIIFPLTVYIFKSKPMNTRETVLKLVMKIGNISESEAEEIGITNDIKLESELGLDSLDRTELCVELEKECNIVIPDDEMERWTTFGDVVQSVDINLKGSEKS